jgi:ABC-type spermidine/putrescine transport system permease subunit I
MIGRVVWDEMFYQQQWPRALLAVVMITLIIVPLII